MAALITLFYVLSVLPCFGDISQEKILKMTACLEETVERADLKELAPQISKILKLDAPVVSALLLKEFKLSDMALFKLTLEKTRMSPQELLLESNPDNISEKLASAHVTLAEFEEFFDGINAEFAFYMLDHKKAKKKRA